MGKNAEQSVETKDLSVSLEVEVEEVLESLRQIDREIEKLDMEREENSG